MHNTHQTPTSAIKKEVQMGWAWEEQKRLIKWTQSLNRKLNWS